MQVIADLHLHSKYARATSPSSDLNGLSEGAKTKGVQVLATGDFTHPNWFKELKLGLENQDNDTGLYEFNGVKFLLSVEVANLFHINGELKKMHHVILAPNFEVAAQISDKLSKRGNLAADGRPIFGQYSAAQLVEEVMEISKDNFVIPAHIWTPWFSLFGSKSGVDDLKEAYGGMEKHIHALETGLSSDPAMNWMISKLDKYTLVSNSDSHSPEKMGREANVLDLEKVTYSNIINAIKTRKGFVKTYEFFPDEGKYHYDGHRDCNVLLDPWEAKKLNNRCPVCKRELTIGVMHRVADLADRKMGEKPANAIPFQHIVPLPTVIAKALGKTELAKPVREEYDKLIRYFGNEFAVYEATEEQLRMGASKEVADALVKVNSGKIHWIPGYDGVFGELLLDGEEAKARTKKVTGPKAQKGLDEFL